MNRSEFINELAAALSKAQAAMSTAKKGETATVTSRKTGQTYTYNYATMESIVDALRVPFKDNGLSFTQLPEATQGDEVRVETVLLHSSGQWISSTVRIPVSVADAQGFGSALTYACKYGLRSIAGIPTSEDDDGAAAVKAKPRATEAEMMPRSTVTDVPFLATTKPDGAYDATAPLARPEGRTVFSYKNGQYSTAGLTKEQFVASLDLAKKVVIKYKDPNKAHNLLIAEFGVKTRNELTEETGAHYLARLQELADSE